MLTNPNNSRREMVISRSALALTGAGRLNNGDTPMP